MRALIGMIRSILGSCRCNTHFYFGIQIYISNTKYGEFLNSISVRDW